MGDDQDLGEVGAHQVDGLDQALAALQVLAAEALVDHQRFESGAGPPRKYYRLTETGRAQLAALDDYWNRINRTISEIGH